MLKRADLSLESGKYLDTYFIYNFNQWWRRHKNIADYWFNNKIDIQKIQHLFIFIFNIFIYFSNFEM